MDNLMLNNRSNMTLQIINNAMIVSLKTGATDFFLTDCIKIFMQHSIAMSVRDLQVYM